MEQFDLTRTIQYAMRNAFTVIQIFTEAPIVKGIPISKIITCALNDAANGTRELGGHRT